MFNLFSKRCLSFALALVCTSTSLMAWFDSDSCQSCDSCECPSGRLYIGGFGGQLFPDSTRISQYGTAFFTEAEGGPLAVIGEGRTRKNQSAGFGGVQLGYEWARNNGCSSWSLAPALEFEAFFWSHSKKGHLINPTNRLPEHDFAVSFNMNHVALLGNIVLAFKNDCLWGFTPYVGGGIGATRIDLRNAKSEQVAPVEIGINHFNSKRSDSTWAFAAQAKAGLRYNICDSFHVFAEYRFLYVDSSNYVLGSTDYPTHVPTSPWNVRVNNIQYNAYVLGLQYDL